MKVILDVVEGPHKGLRFEFDGHDNFIVGRAKNARFRLPNDDRFFSRNHFLVEVNPPLCRLLDLNSRNGTFVNGHRVSTVDLRHGDKIRGGQTILQVMIEGGVDPLPLPNLPAPEVPRQTPVSPGTIARIPTSPTPTIKLPRAHAGANRSDEGDAETGAFEHGSIEQICPGYRLLKVIGRGGMGTVYLADRLTDGTQVAVKIVNPNVPAGSEELARFSREAEILQELRHPNIVGFRDIGASSGRLYFVMDYVDGPNADAVLLASGRPLPIGRSVQIVLQLLAGLAYAHEQGFIHRDVKPANVLIVNRHGRDHVYLADFGLARAYQSSRLSGITVTGTIGGSLPYMPPEQITDFRHVSPQADQYSAAATLYFLLTGKPVYDLPKEVPGQLLMILQEDPIPISSRRPDLPPRLVDVIHRALLRDPKHRFDGVSAMAMALVPFAGE